jgi:hypothetical protein
MSCFAAAAVVEMKKWGVDWSRSAAWAQLRKSGAQPMSHSTHQWAVRKMLLLFFLLSFFGLVAVRDKSWKIGS